jgi:tRNA-specific 2-thiouridylase
VVGSATDLLVDEVRVDDLWWVGPPVAGPLLAQASAHGEPRPGQVDGDRVRFTEPQRRVAPGQAVVLYDGDVVVGAGTAA